jgi:hypothetical protein
LDGVKKIRGDLVPTNEEEWKWVDYVGKILVAIDVDGRKPLRAAVFATNDTGDKKLKYANWYDNHTKCALYVAQPADKESMLRGKYVDRIQVNQPDKNERLHPLWERARLPLDNCDGKIIFFQLLNQDKTLDRIGVKISHGPWAPLRLAFQGEYRSKEKETGGYFWTNTMINGVEGVKPSILPIHVDFNNLREDVSVGLLIKFFDSDDEVSGKEVELPKPQKYPGK